MSTQPESDDVEGLKRENAVLREKLARAQREADIYRETVNVWLHDEDPYVPPTEEELHDMLHGPRGRSPLEIVEEFEQKYLRDVQ